MSNERTRTVESERGWAGVLGRALLSALVASAALGGMATRAEAQTVIVENGRAVSLPHTVGDMTIVEPGEATGPGAGPSLAAGGAFLLTAGWVSSFAVGLHEGPDLFISDEELNGAERQWYQDFRFTSFLPVVGPWIALSQQKTSEFDDDFWGVWLIANGLLQAAGVTMIVGGIIASVAHGARMGHRVASRPTVSEGALTLMPSVSPQQATLTASGYF